MTEITITIEDAQSLVEGRILKIIRLKGQLDESNVDEEIQAVYKVLEENPTNLDIIFDFENLEYLNSKAIGYFTDIYGKISASGGKVAIAKARPNIVDILQVVGLTQLITMYEKEEEAAKGLATQDAMPSAATPAEPVQEVAPVAPAPAAPVEAAPPAPAVETPVEPAIPAPIPETPVEPAPVEATPTPEPAPMPEPVQVPETPAPVEPAPITPEPVEAAPEAIPAAPPAPPESPVTPTPEATPETPAPAPAEGDATYKFEQNQ